MWTSAIYLRKGLHLPWKTSGLNMAMSSFVRCQYRSGKVCHSIQGSSIDLLLCNQPRRPVQKYQTYLIFHKYFASWQKSIESQCDLCISYKVSSLLHTHSHSLAVLCVCPSTSKRCLCGKVVLLTVSALFWSYKPLSSYQPCLDYIVPALTTASLLFICFLKSARKYLI